MSNKFCVVFGCRNSVLSPNKQNTDCRFLNFPLHRKDLTDVWLQELNLVGWTPGPESVICEEHFSLDSFEITNNEKFLKQEAVPNIIDELDRILLQYEFLDSQNEEIARNFAKDGELRCRMCAASISSQDAVDVYSEDEKVIMKIRTCIPILIRTQDYLPKYICCLCLSDLNISYRMLIRAIESEKFFKSLLTQGQKTDDDTIIVEEAAWHPKNSLNADDTRCNLRSDGNTSSQENNQEIASIDDSVLNSVDGRPDDSRPVYAIREIHSTINSNTEGDVGNRIRDVSNMSSSNVTALNFHAEQHCDSLKCDENTTVTEVCPLFSCRHCSTTYESMEKLNEHLETHVVSVWYEDSVQIKDMDQGMPNTSSPSKIFSSKLIEDTDQATVNASSPTSVCKICFTVFPTLSAFVQHSRSVHNLKYVGNDINKAQTYKCEECNKEFKYKLNFDNHKRVHTGARPYVCENCGNSFRSRGNLIQHFATHTGVKKYKCSVCNKMFARKYFVDAHMRRHTGEKPFKCKICENEYTQVGDLRRHIRNSHESKLHKALPEKRFVVRTMREIRRSTTFQRQNIDYHEADSDYEFEEAAAAEQ